MCNCAEGSNNIENGITSSLGKAGKSLAQGATDLINRDYCSREVEIKRLEACMSCPHRINKIFDRKPDKILKTDICALCLCRLKGWIGIFPPKTKLKNSVCDSGRWPA